VEANVRQSKDLQLLPVERPELVDGGLEADAAQPRNRYFVALSPDT
jgi:hypothetical protein